MNLLTVRIRFAEPSLGKWFATTEVAIFRGVRNTLTSPFSLMRYLEERHPWSWTWLEFFLTGLLTILFVSLFIGAVLWRLRGDSSFFWITSLVWCIPQLICRVPAEYLDIVDYEDDGDWG